MIFGLTTTFKDTNSTYPQGLITMLLNTDTEITCFITGQQLQDSILSTCKSIKRVDNTYEATCVIPERGSITITLFNTDIEYSNNQASLALDWVPDVTRCYKVTMNPYQVDYYGTIIDLNLSLMNIDLKDIYSYDTLGAEMVDAIFSQFTSAYFNSHGGSYQLDIDSDFMLDITNRNGIAMISHSPISTLQNDDIIVKLSDLMPHVKSASLTLT